MTDSATDTVELTGELLALAAVELDDDVLLRFEGPDTVLPSSYRVTDAAAALVAAVSVAVARLATVRSPERIHQSMPAVTVDRVEACAAFQSERHFRLEEEPTLWDELSGHYETNDGHVQFHTNFEHHRSAMLQALGCREDAVRADVAAVVAERGRFEMEQAVSEAGGIAAALRTSAEWAQHPHAAHVAGRAPLAVAAVDTSSTGHGGAGELPSARVDRPLLGVRVLDLTRVIAGPVCTRTLAAYGAHVLRIGAERLPVADSILPDTTLGKRFAHCDITTAEGRDTLLGLVSEADVIVSGFRPGALAARGLDTDDLLTANPNLVIARLSAFGADGPWGGRRGFDSITQTATGVVATETAAFGADRPRPLPCQLLDHGSGYLLSLGVLSALLGRHLRGGARLVDVSLLTTCNWVASLGPADPSSGSPLSDDDVARYRQQRPSPFGPLRHMRHPGRIDGIPARWDRGPTRPGADKPRW
ncbi:MAG: CoA transferase [Acidimicrobiales bacterium]